MTSSYGSRRGRQHKNNNMDYQEQIGPQRKTLDALESEYAATPSEELKAKLVRETDLLRYLENAVKGDPRNRAASAAQAAKVFVLSKLIA